MNALAPRTLMASSIGRWRILFLRCGEVGEEGKGGRDGKGREGKNKSR